MLNYDFRVLENWEMAHLKLENLGSEILPSKDSDPSGSDLPVVYQAEVTLDLADTFLNTTSFSRGVALVDTFNLGRYWSSEGPQQTLFVPRAIRNATSFILTLIEFEVSTEDATVDFLDYPILRSL